jgi:hypothetical protein
MSALETYLKAIRDSKGIEHMSAVSNLRGYMRLSTNKEIYAAIYRMQDIDLFRHLIEAGLKPELLSITLKRYDALKAQAEVKG